MAQNEDIIERMTVGGSFELGMPCDCRNGTLISGFTFWISEVLKGSTLGKPKQCLDYAIETEDSLHDKVNLLEVESNLKLGILSGLVVETCVGTNSSILTLPEKLKTCPTLPVRILNLPYPIRISKNVIKSYPTRPVG